MAAFISEHGRSLEVHGRLPCSACQAYAAQRTKIEPGKGASTQFRFEPLPEKPRDVVIGLSGDPEPPKGSRRMRSVVEADPKPDSS